MTSLESRGLSGASTAPWRRDSAEGVDRSTVHLGAVSGALAVVLGFSLVLWAVLDRGFPRSEPWLALALSGTLGLTVGVFAISRWRPSASWPSPLPPLEEAWHGMAHEINRARRLERPASLVVLRYRETERALLGLADRLIRIGLRDMDIWALSLSQRELIVLAPETNHPQALRLAVRLAEALPLADRLKLLCGVAVFPEDGLGLEALLERARATLEAGHLLPDWSELGEPDQEIHADSTGVCSAA